MPRPSGARKLGLQTDSPGGRLGGACERSASIPGARSWVCERSASPPGECRTDLLLLVHRKVGVAALRGGSSLALKGGLGPRILIHFNTCAPLGERPPFGAVWRFGVGPGRSPPQTHHCLSCNACKPPQGVIKLIQLSTTDLLAFASMKNAAKVRNVM
jgi:hypothetical protein